jgi:hypothetical protein
MAPNRPMIHETIALINVLAGNDIRALEKNFTFSVNDFSRIRR